MADPTGTNLTADQAKRIDLLTPTHRIYSIGARLRNLRTDLDAVEAGDASTTAVLAALAAAGSAVALNDQRVTGCSGVTASGGDTFTIVCETGQGAELTASTGTKFSWNQTGISFFGEAVIAQPSAIADAADAGGAISQLNLVIAALENLGLIAS